MRLIPLLLLTLAANTFAVLPSIPGYKPSTLTHNLPLPVNVQGEGISEQSSPVVVYLPEPGAAPIADASLAAALPELPSRCGDYQLVVLHDGANTDIVLRDGRKRRAEIPLFAYNPMPSVVVAPASAVQIPSSTLPLSTETRTLELQQSTSTVVKAAADLDKEQNAKTDIVFTPNEPNPIETALSNTTQYPVTVSVQPSIQTVDQPAVSSLAASPETPSQNIPQVAATTPNKTVEPSSKPVEVVFDLNKASAPKSNDSIRIEVTDAPAVPASTKLEVAKSEQPKVPVSTIEVAKAQPAAPTNVTEVVFPSNPTNDVSKASLPEHAQVEATVAKVETPKPAVTWDDIITNEADFKNSLSIGEFVFDERQSLRSRLPIHADFFQRPLSEVLLNLAVASGLNYQLGALPTGDPIVTTRFTASPFAAMEQIAKQNGVGIYHDKEDPLWVIRKVDPETLFARQYQLNEIHLGNSAGAAGEESFGSTFANQNGANGTSSSSNSSRRTSSSNSNSSSSQLNGVNGTSGTTSVAAGSTEDFAARFDQPSDIILTIKSILGLIEQAPMVSELSGSADDSGKPHVSTKPTGANAQKGVAGLVSYNAESNSLFVVATERQHEWIGEYLKQVDKPISTISIDAMFVEHDINPNENTGIDWSQSAVNWKVGTDSLNWGTLDKPKLPTGVLLASDGINAKINAYIQETKSRVSSYPRVVTSNNREVRIGTTQNVPIITNASTVAGAVSLNTSGNASGTAQTNYSSGTQEIGTIITLLPSKISKDKIYMKISIEISSNDSGSNSGEQLTGRVSTTSTVYEGEIAVPAGKTLAIGGLERIAEQSGIGRIPLISRIPMFGFLFKKKETDFKHKNISLFITPRFVDDGSLPTASERHDKAASSALSQSASLEKRADKEFKKADFK